MLVSFVRRPVAWVGALLLGSTLSALPAGAQSLPSGLSYATYSWNATPKLHALSGPDAEAPALILRNLSVREFAVRPEDKVLRLYHLVHRIIRVNSTDAIETFNKLIIPLPDDARLVYLKARTLRPGGGVTEANQGNLKELKDDEGGRGYKVFAVEGVELGSEIEFMYAIDKTARSFGSEMLQADLPTRDETIEIISPEEFTFEARLYHAPPGTATPRDTVVGGKRTIRVALARVPAAHAEPFAWLEAQLGRLEYKLAYNGTPSHTRLYTWAEAAQVLHKQVYELSKDEQKAVTRYLKELKLPAGADAGTRIRTVEQNVKTAFTLNPGAPSDLEAVLKNRAASELGFTRLFGAVFRQLGIEHDLIFTCDRTDAAFDGGFDTWNSLDHNLLFFPSTNQYFAPGQLGFRAGMVPAEWTATPGLWVKTVKLGSTESAVGTVRDIPALAADQSPNDHVLTVRFAPDLGSATVGFKQIFGGYQAQPIQPYYNLIPEAKRTELLQSLVKQSVPDATFDKLTISNTESDRNPLDHPLTLDATVQSVGLLTKAGNRYLFKIGELIGPQSELYQQEARQFDVENPYNRRYNRTITFEVPTGYRVRNLADLNLKAEAGPAATPAYFFRSGSAQTGRTVTVSVAESYNQVHWPKQNFEAFRNVVNAAANFNKVVLVLEKE